MRDISLIQGNRNKLHHGSGFQELQEEWEENADMKEDLIQALLLLPAPVKDANRKTQIFGRKRGENLPQSMLMMQESWKEASPAVKSAEKFVF